jgi:hydrogenase maturation factor HypF (carbamoyltransferase family)
MNNPHEYEVENTKVRVRCPECRTTFRERLHRVVHGDSVVCPTCQNEMRFHGIGHIHEHDSVADYIHHVEERTSHPHFSLGD